MSHPAVLSSRRRRAAAERFSPLRALSTPSRRSAWWWTLLSLLSITAFALFWMWPITSPAYAYISQKCCLLSPWLGPLDTYIAGCRGCWDCVRIQRWTICGPTAWPPLWCLLQEPEVLGLMTPEWILSNHGPFSCFLLSFLEGRIWSGGFWGLLRVLRKMVRHSLHVLSVLIPVLNLTHSSHYLLVWHEFGIIQYLAYHFCFYFAFNAVPWDW